MIMNNLKWNCNKISTHQCFSNFSLVFSPKINIKLASNILNLKCKFFSSNNMVNENKISTKKIYNKKESNPIYIEEKVEKINELNQSNELNLFNKNDTNYKIETKDKLEEYFNRMYEFNRDFNIISPVNIGNSKFKSKEELLSNEEDIAFRKISNFLQSKKVRQKGSNYLIDLLISVYKNLIGIRKDERITTAENFYNRLNLKKNHELERKIKEIFTRNDIIDSINLIIRHINDLKSEEMEKLINILVKVKYSNYENWKKILRQYILAISLLGTGFVPLEKKSIVGILLRLKEMYTFIPNNSDQEIQQLIQRSIDESITYLLKNFHQIEPRIISTTLSSIGKLGLLDEAACMKIEHILIDVIKNIEITDFSKIFFSIYKNKCASIKLRETFEKKINEILDDYKLNEFKLNSDVLYVFARGLYFYYKSSDKQNPLFKKIEEIYITHYKKLDFDHNVSIAFSILHLCRASESFFTVFNLTITNFNKLEILTEFIVDQILNISMKRNEISLDNITKYFNVYKQLLISDKVNRRQLDLLKHNILYRMKRGGNSPELLNYLENVLQEINEISLSPHKIKF